ncbi:MAG: hypothetical protein K2Q20_05945, partial [Phycisphaerales bacterium]|nr:hypothetical protein [Phycisphaerales bacterium]
FELHGFGGGGKPERTKKSYAHQAGPAPTPRPAGQAPRPSGDGPRPFKADVKFPKKSGPSGPGAKRFGGPKRSDRA